MPVNRRVFATAGMALLCMPTVLRAQSDPAIAIRTAARGLDQLQTIMVQRGTEVIVAEAYRGASLKRAANIKSCSKSLLALLLGAAIARGDIKDLSQTLAEVAPRLIPQDATEGAAGLTMENLVTLRGGLGSTSGPNYGSWISSRNWVAYALRQPRLGPNGGPMIYSTGTTHVLGAALAVATGQTLLQQARQTLGQGLGIDVPAWTRDPQGYYFGGNEMALTPEAMLRVAVMMRDGGQFDGRQVVPADWVRASQQGRTRSPFSGLAYGYGWFLSRDGWTIARGYGGQIIASNTRRNLAVAITSDPTRPARSDGHFGDLMRLIDGPIMAAA
ncbi:MAG: 6-aminohexanoate hydrolase [Paracoccus denitrificans]|nr:MAG: 6-aminohexanoate hydrolase [Paracoccus denitrificans]PZO85032.1 MAG: 6-aminohexanoate hydrolase [Paracoccus denitrificans]